jgi:hypothetical protein
MGVRDDEASHICGVCGRVLDWGPKVGFIHNIMDASEELDHIAVPVPAADAPQQVRARCDFCSGENPTWELPARDFEFEGIAGSGSIGDWAACDICADLIRKNAWTALTKRSAEWFGKNNNQPPLDGQGLANLRRMHRQLRQNITGPIRPLTPF